MTQYEKSHQIQMIRDACVKWGRASQAIELGEPIAQAKATDSYLGGTPWAMVEESWPTFTLQRADGDVEEIPLTFICHLDVSALSQVMTPFRDVDVLQLYMHTEIEELNGEPEFCVRTYTKDALTKLVPLHPPADVACLPGPIGIAQAPLVTEHTWPTHRGFPPIRDVVRNDPVIPHDDLERALGDLVFERDISKLGGWALGLQGDIDVEDSNYCLALQLTRLDGIDHPMFEGDVNVCLYRVSNSNEHQPAGWFVEFSMA